METVPRVALDPGMPTDVSPDKLRLTPAPSRPPRALKVGLHRTQAQGSPDCVGTAQHLTSQGLQLTERPSPELGRFVWLDLELDDGEPVRALGEIVPSRTAVDRACDIRFKHLFPDHRRRLLDALDQEQR